MTESSTSALAVELAKVAERVDLLAGGLEQLNKSQATTGEVERLRYELGQLAVLVRELSEQSAGSDSPAGVRAPWWPDVPAEQREAALGTLFRWINEVLRARHADAYSRLTACWYRHPDVVDELFALRAAWQGAYRSKPALPTAALEWHDRWLPGCVARVTKALGSCKGGHEEPRIRDTVKPDEVRRYLAEQ